MTASNIYVAIFSDLDALANAVMTVGRRQRDLAFETLKAEMERALLNLEAGQYGEEIDPVELAGFAGKARIYLRALSTYPAASNEWMDVFRAFKSHFDDYLRRTRCLPERQQKELERLRQNPRLILREPEV